MRRKYIIVLAICLALAAGAEAKTLFLQTGDQTAGGAGNQAGGPSVNFPLQTFKLNYISAKDLADTLSGVLGGGEGVKVNEKLNAIIVRASEKTIKRVAELLKQLDVPPLQVEVEAKIIELRDNSGDTTDPSSLGVNWKYTKNSNDYVQLLTNVSTSSATSLGLYAQLLSGNTQAYLEALQKTIGYDVVAAPWISALNNEEASILIGSKIGYMTTFISTTGTAQNISFLEVGTKLTFTPHISPDGYIVMEINPSLSDGSVSTAGIPNSNNTETKNKVLVKDGQAIVIGGLTQKSNKLTEIGVPILSSIPFIGLLFRRTELLTEKRSLMVIVTPHIVTPTFLAELKARSEELDQQRDKWSREKAKLIH